VKTVFFDIDTQIDFLFPAGALYVPGSERLLPVISRLNRYAATHGIPVVSTTCAHAEDDAEFREWPPHCVYGTVGQQKPAATLLEKRSGIPNRSTEFGINGAEQIILEKQQLDLFSNPNIRALLDILEADRYVVYGVVTEYCVGLAAMGLLATGKPVTLITDAIETLKPEASARTLHEFTAHGGVLSTVHDVLHL